jgi:hypothetical protein
MLNKLESGGVEARSAFSQNRPHQRLHGRHHRDSLGLDTWLRLCVGEHNPISTGLLHEWLALDLVCFLIASLGA